ncbi:hypothetical protein [Nocardioides sp. zg-DK7169]|uniref:hypothetical protein n=1 Tax=Nocardioides sp. zg-DK7169 TaxID=2736600 RepID=UPI0015523CA4|nr:hypothetical protein [Nocardioides sp. zg-DK7169]NPC97888.1 hypothetical protein [Nocardioides sp. zg-DK7169]
MARGYNAWADVRRTTADGRDINELYDELTAAAQLANEQQQRFLDLFTYNTSAPVVSVLQTLGAGDAAFEEASEYGIATSKRTAHDTLNMGATFKWYDNRWAATWRYLADATSAEIEASTNAILAADQDLIFREVMRTIFNPANRKVTDRKTNTVYDVFAFANGDGWVPPEYAGNTFNGSHTHYRTSHADTVASADLDEILDDFKSHGYSAENGSQIVLFVNAAEANVIGGFRVASGARADFIPSQGQRFFANEGDLVGSQVASTFAGFPVKGSYDEALVIESSRIPAGYVAAMVSGGSLVPSNPIMFRQHERIQGLQLIPGAETYPLQDSYWTRGFGTGVRHRLAGLVMQITTNTTYAPPALYVG